MNALPARKDSARNWFETLRDRICAALEEIEGGVRFERKPWERKEGGGGAQPPCRRRRDDGR